MSRNAMADVRLIEPRGRPHIECPKCRVSVVWPSSLTASEAAAFADVTRRRTLDGARYAVEKLGLDMREAKALAYRVTRTKGICHRCKSQVIGSESVCTKCRSANLDWYQDSRWPTLATGRRGHRSAGCGKSPTCVFRSMPATSS